MSDLRVGLLGVGMMGVEHALRLTHRISGARLVAVSDPATDRAQQLAAGLQDVAYVPDAAELVASDDVDAVVIASPGFAHEAQVLACLERGKPVLCEKPLTMDAASSYRLVEAEAKGGRPLVQVGFMRRFDAEYMALRDLVASGDLGALLLMHCAHRNPSTPPSYTETMLITDSVVHEFDTVPWLAGEPIVSVEVRKPRRNSLAPADLDEPQLVIVELASGAIATVEINVNAQFGYQVTTEAVFERGVAETGKTAGLKAWTAGRWSGAEHMSFKTRFGPAFDTQIQRWVDAAHQGTIDGASAWDGYLAAAACEAGVEAQRTGGRVEVSTVARPSFYDPIAPR